MTLAWRGPIFAIGALAVLFLALVGFSLIGRWLRKSQ
jgi:hypothetical protein